MSRDGPPDSNGAAKAHPRMEHRSADTDAILQGDADDRDTAWSVKRYFLRYNKTLPEYPNGYFNNVALPPKAPFPTSIYKWKANKKRWQVVPEKKLPGVLEARQRSWETKRTEWQGNDAQGAGSGEDFNRFSDTPHEMMDKGANNATDDGNANANLKRKRSNSPDLAEENRPRDFHTTDSTTSLAGATSTMHGGLPPKASRPRPKLEMGPWIRHRPSVTLQKLYLENVADAVHMVTSALQLLQPKEQKALKYLDGVHMGGMKMLNEIWGANFPELDDFALFPTFDDIIESLEVMGVEESRRHLKLRALLSFLHAARVWRIGLRTAHLHRSKIDKCPEYPPDYHLLAQEGTNALRKQLYDWLKDAKIQTIKTYDSVLRVLCATRMDVEAMEADVAAVPSDMVKEWNEGTDEERNDLLSRLFREAMNKEDMMMLHRAAFAKRLREICVLASLSMVEPFLGFYREFESDLVSVGDSLGAQ